VSALGRMIGGQPMLLVSPGPDTAVLREACAGEWYFPRRADGQIVRELPEKTHPHSDVADALCYAVGRILPKRDPRPKGWRPEPAKGVTMVKRVRARGSLEKLRGDLYQRLERETPGSPAHSRTINDILSVGRAA
jgi:hypothetical protein